MDCRAFVRNFSALYTGTITETVTFCAFFRQTKGSTSSEALSQTLLRAFINALVNRIAIVRVQSANFNNPYAILKKGYLEFGESIEDIFVSIANVVDFSAEKIPVFKNFIISFLSLFENLPDPTGKPS